MTDTPLIRAGRALARKESGEDCWDSLDDAMKANLLESVRVVQNALAETDHKVILREYLALTPINRRQFVHVQVLQGSFADDASFYEAMIDALNE